MMKAFDQANDVALRLAGQLSAPERRDNEDRLRQLAQQLVDLDTQILKVQLRILEKELSETNRDLDELLADRDQRAQKRFEDLVDKARKSNQRGTEG